MMETAQPFIIFPLPLTNSSIPSSFLSRPLKSSPLATTKKFFLLVRITFFVIFAAWSVSN